MSDEIPEATEPMLELHLVTNPLWLGSIGPNIAKYVEHMTQKTITYESFYSYLCHMVQFGQNTKGAELWVVTLDSVPAGFALMSVDGLPFVGSIRCEHITNWTRDRRVIPALGEKMKEFARQNRAPYMVGAINSKAGVRHFAKLAEQCNLDMQVLNISPVVWREKNV